MWVLSEAFKGDPCPLQYIGVYKEQQDIIYEDLADDVDETSWKWNYNCSYLYASQEEYDEYEYRIEEVRSDNLGERNYVVVLYEYDDFLEPESSTAILVTSDISEKHMLELMAKEFIVYNDLNDAYYGDEYRHLVYYEIELKEVSYAG